jgi:hypothetical protein
MDVVIVRAPGSMHSPTRGSVLIEYLSPLGPSTSIERPAIEAVPLFWRFVREEFGLEPSD